MTLSNPFTHDPRVYQEAKTLSEGGHKVTVLAWDRKGQHPLKDIKDGIDVVRVRNTKLMDSLPYDILRLRFWWKEGYKKSLKLHEKKPFDVVHCHDLDTLPIGVDLKKKNGLPLIYDAHEIWGYMVEMDLSKLVGNHFLRKEKDIIKYADRIITVNEPLKKYFQKITNKPITIIMNCKPLKETSYNPPSNDTFTITYIGALGKSRFLSELVELVKELRDVHCIIGGTGKPEFISTLKGKCSEIRNVDFIGKVPFENVLPITKKSNAVICIFDPNNKNNQVGLPNKIFEAMICGRPIICTKGIYSGEFVEREKCGIAVDYREEDVRKGILKLRDNPKLREELGRNGLTAAIEKYNWGKQEEKLAKAYESL